MCYTVLDSSNRQVMTKTTGKKDASKPDHRRTPIGKSATPRMIKEAVSFIEKLADKDSKRKEKKSNKKTEDGVVRRLAKQGLMDKTKAKAARKSTATKKNKKKGGDDDTFILLKLRAKQET